MVNRYIISEVISLDRRYRVRESTYWSTGKEPHKRQLKGSSLVNRYGI